jgi:hypothetical protein
MRSLISVDTRNAIVARAAIGAGADMINDISGMILLDPLLLWVLQCAYEAQSVRVLLPLLSCDADSCAFLCLSPATQTPSNVPLV